jgi:hypothetical protein
MEPVVIRDHFQCNACLVPRTYEIYIITVKYPAKGNNKHEGFCKLQTFFGRGVSFHKAHKQST